MPRIKFILGIKMPPEQALLPLVVIRDAEEVSGLGWVLRQCGAVGIDPSRPGPIVSLEAVIIAILADTGMRTKDLDRAAAQATMEHAREAMAQGPSPEDYDKLLTELNMEMALLRAIDEIRRK